MATPAVASGSANPAVQVTLFFCPCGHQQVHSGRCPECKRTLQDRWVDKTTLSPLLRTQFDAMWRR